MLRFTTLIALGAVAVGLMAASATAGAVTQKFVGPFGGTSPCNGEFVFGSGPGHAVYEQNDGHFVLHFAMRVRATGSLGNGYLRAPNYESLFTVRIFVFDAEPVGSTFLGPATEICLG